MVAVIIHQSKYLLNYFLQYLFVYMFVHKPVMVCTWRSEDNFQQVVLPFPRAGLDITLRLSGSVTSSFTHWFISPSKNILHLWKISISSPFLTYITSSSCWYSISQSRKLVSSKRYNVPQKNKFISKWWLDPNSSLSHMYLLTWVHTAPHHLFFEFLIKI